VIHGTGGAVLVASSEKAKRELGWKPRFADLETIIETAWRWHRDHPDGYDVQRCTFKRSNAPK